MCGRLFHNNNKRCYKKVNYNLGFYRQTLDAFLEHLAKRCVRFYFFSLSSSSCLFYSTLHFSSNYGLAVVFSFCSFFFDESMQCMLFLLFCCYVLNSIYNTIRFSPLIECGVIKTLKMESHNLM